MKLCERAEMVQYYRYLENCMLNILSKCILKAITIINGLFTIDANSNYLSGGQKVKNFLFTVKYKSISYKEVI